MLTDTDRYLQQFGEHLKNLRIDRGLSQQELGEKVALSSVIISRIEAGTYDISLVDLYHLSLIFGKKQTDMLDF